MFLNKKISYIFLVMLILNILLVSSAIEKITLKPGESYSSKDKNISLVRSSENYVILCVNQQKKILTRDQWFDNIYFDLINKDRNSVTMKINVDCKENCICNGKCDNSECLLDKQTTLLEENKTENNQTTIKNTLKDQELIKPPTSIEQEQDMSKTLIAVTIILILAIILLGIILLKTRKETRV